MARAAPKYLLNRDGRYFARLVIPKELRPFLDNKTELREALGPDRRAALAKLHPAVANLQGQIALAEREAQIAAGAPIEPGRYPLPVDQIALRNYNERLAFDTELRNMDNRHAMGLIDDRLVELLREGIAGVLSDDSLEALVGNRIDKYRRLGNTTVAKGSTEWRTLARAMCVSELEALARVAERDEGDFGGQPEHPMLANVEPAEEEAPPVMLRDLFNRYVAELKANGKGTEAEKRWRPIIDDLIAFARTPDARKITKKTILEWKDAKIKTLAPRTVKDVYLTAVNAVFNWAVSNDQLTENPASTVKLRVAKKVQNRPKGFTRDEATAILKFTLAYVPKQTDNPQTQEKPQTSAAKKWAPLICAFTGARISEITQLRKSDVRMEGDIPVIRITPDAGTVKTRKFRDVPLHKQIIEKGFLDFVNASPDGPLFYPPMKGKRTANPARTVSGRISNWLQKEKLIPDEVQPNHGWRHALKTTGPEVEIDSRILDAITGHAGRTAGDDYGDVTIVAKKKAIDKLPDFPI
ncbi:tyrosine-type recombinase/integrase [Sinorhizobium medicae]|uniref:tyrosine-type recombinase/integrase n=1 Tax=Sinorhizobium medicae TaxID=110321 RepID=UPI0004160154|nr:tyrosine-type recombinase/integrase [Sinorhizobium medicae]MDX0695446.1 tyrosine-type recombinase/integrase [Sinorhizobium medicae]MDX0744968.1 tyrosine-type recombinase/integrase [Sinorhizobium medicae]